ncbi:MAG: UvrABC system protein C [Chlamydiales bacterium]|nr:UvrABC system protein C [Chlamydiales bacterium]
MISIQKKRTCSLIFPQKGNKKSLLAIAEANAKACFSKEKGDKDQKEQLLIQLEERLQLTHYPEKIECFDNSHISGSEPVSAMVVFINGEKASSHYRKYKIKEAVASDDYGALKEVLKRRYTKAKKEGALPDLIVIDGGKGHLNLACKVLSELDISTVDILSVAKEEGRHDKGMRAEQIFVPGRQEPYSLKVNSPLLFFLQRIRDEAHRFAISFHKQRRGKQSLASSLDALPGIGPIKKKRLLQHFGSLKRILEASPDKWKEVKGMTHKDIETLLSLSLLEKKQTSE